MRPLVRHAFWAALACAALPALPATLKATLLTRADDPRLDRSQVERAYLGHPAGLPADAVQLAIDEAQFELDAAGAGVALASDSAASLEAARAAAQKAEKAGAAMLLVDLPTDWTVAITRSVKLPVLNVGDPADRLREADCSATLWHLLPSERMRADALAQALTARKWSQVLLLTGPAAGDVPRSATAQAALRRYGLKVVAAKPFKLSADPRERDLANPLLLTGGLSYDVVWVVDTAGEFARSLPYRTALPRPVVGDAGLVAVTWHAQFERFGAPEVSRRFWRATKRPMTGHDWAAWMAGKALVQAAVTKPQGPVAAWSATLALQQLDGSKGVNLGFRAWDGQLRQPLLLTDGQGVIATAPIDGLLHPRNVLDTLGADAPEKLCKARSP